MRYLVKSTLVSLGDGRYAEQGQWLDEAELQNADLAHLTGNSALISEEDAQAQAGAAVTGQDPETTALRTMVAELERELQRASGDLEQALPALREMEAEITRLREQSEAAQAMAQNESAQLNAEIAALAAERDEARAELAAANEALEKAQADAAAARDEDPEDARVTELLKLSKDELVAAATEKGIDTSGTKADIAARISNAEFAQE